MPYEQILYDVADNILTITLNRPEKLNAFTGIMMNEMLDAFDKVDADDNVRAVIVTGAGAGTRLFAGIKGANMTINRRDIAAFGIGAAALVVAGAAVPARAQTKNESGAEVASLTLAEIAKLASGDEILVSAISKDILESSGEFRFDPIRETELKGLSGKHRLFAVSWRDEA